MPDEHITNGVRITNSDIYSKLVAVERDVLSVKQTQEQVILPKLTEHKDRLDKLDFRVYGVVAGLAGTVSALIVGRATGLI